MEAVGRTNTSTGGIIYIMIRFSSHDVSDPSDFSGLLDSLSFLMALISFGSFLSFDHD